ncbi:MAG: KTSC domain-containing protein [Anaerolineaceae bacterium]|nr:MAG: KTSC domain-containing protein [Anaerolineaceae bacterium]
MPLMQEVESSNIASIGHDEEENALHVQFKNGGHYVYSGIARDAFNEILKAKSVGGYIHKHVKGQCACRKIEIKK